MDTLMMKKELLFKGFNLSGFDDRLHKLQRCMLMSLEIYSSTFSSLENLSSEEVA
jgi:hypothetical protein